MKKVVEVYGKTVESAIADAAVQLGVDREHLSYEILEEPKRGFLGFGEVPAKVRISYDTGDEDTAIDFVRRLIEDMGIDAQAEISDISGGKLISISGSDAGVLIGHHGATLDALQYLVNLAANKRSDILRREEEAAAEAEPEPEPEPELEEDDGSIKNQMTERSRTVGKGYVRITLDIENYREKREQTLRALARRMAYRVQKYKKSVTLEPMNPYERRIIHSEVQNISGVTTISVGSDTDRKIIIYSEEMGMPRLRTNDRSGRGNGGRGGRSTYRSGRDGYVSDRRKETEQEYDSESYTDSEPENGYDDE